MQRWRTSRTLVLAAGGLAGAVLVALAVAMSTGVGARGNTGQAAAPFAVAPAFTLPALAADGTFSQPWTLSDVIDRPIFLYFWASWCEPCEREAPLIQRLWPEYEALGYQFVAIDVMDAEADGLAFIRRHGLTFTQLRDDGQTYLAYGVSAVPEGFFLRPGLQTDRRYLGELNEVTLRSMLDALRRPS